MKDESTHLSVKQPFQILVVDDNDAGVFLVRSVLELEGFLVDSADSSDEVLERLKDNAAYGWSSTMKPCRQRLSRAP